MAPTIVAQPDTDQYDEWLDLTAHLFSTTYGLDWHGAAQQADALLPDLLAYAADWDAWARTAQQHGMEVAA